jgi:hypothetical protein
MAGIGSNSSRFNISAEVSTVLPQHIKSNAPDLEVFLKKYLEFLELENKSTYYINNIVNNRDLDYTDDHFLSNIQNEIGQSIPKEFATDSRLLYKHLTELYKSRGTIDSINAFFNVLYNDSAEIYFPKDDMLKPSDGRFIENNLDIDNLDNLALSYTGVAADGYRSAYDSEAMSSDSVNLVKIPEIKNIENSKLFIYKVSGYDGGQATSVSLHEVPSTDRAPSEEDYIALGDINWGELGVPSSYVEGSATALVPSYNEWHFKFDIAISPDTELRFYPRGYSATNDGFISDDTKKIQDSFYYQQFSYEIQTGVAPELWRNAFNRLIHTAGFIFFNKISIFSPQPHVPSPIPTLQRSIPEGEPIIYFWLPVVDAKLKFHEIYNGIHGFESIEDRRAQYIAQTRSPGTNTGDPAGNNGDLLVPTLKDIYYLGISLDLEIDSNKHVNTMGPSQYFDKLKFKLTGGVGNWDSVTFLDVVDAVQTYSLPTSFNEASGLPENYIDIKYTKDVANSNMNSILWMETINQNGSWKYDSEAWNAEGYESPTNPIPSYTSWGP